jgi:hypothetical protein
LLFKWTWFNNGDKYWSIDRSRIIWMFQWSWNCLCTITFLWIIDIIDFLIECFDTFTNFVTRIITIHRWGCTLWIDLFLHFKGFTLLFTSWLCWWWISCQILNIIFLPFHFKFMTFSHCFYLESTSMSSYWWNSRVCKSSHGRTTFPISRWLNIWQEIRRKWFSLWNCFSCIKWQEDCEERCGSHWTSFHMHQQFHKFVDLLWFRKHAIASESLFTSFTE